jgi:hypothetical protein
LENTSFNEEKTVLFSGRRKCAKNLHPDGYPVMLSLPGEPIRTKFCKAEFLPERSDQNGSEIMEICKMEVE